jgi:hypothetical protein
MRNNSAAASVNHSGDILGFASGIARPGPGPYPAGTSAGASRMRAVRGASPLPATGTSPAGRAPATIVASPRGLSL